MFDLGTFLSYIPRTESTIKEWKVKYYMHMYLGYLESAALENVIGIYSHTKNREKQRGI